VRLGLDGKEPAPPGLKYLTNFSDGEPADAATSLLWAARMAVQAASSRITSSGPANG